jgi:hypothetical protein
MELKFVGMPCGLGGGRLSGGGGGTVVFLSMTEISINILLCT